MPTVPLKEAPLSSFGGLYTEADSARALPAGASPLCYDCDFDIGSFTIRPGLTSPIATPAGTAGYQWLKSAALPGTLQYNIFNDTLGNLWYENLAAPGSLTKFYSGILNAARAISASFPQREFIALSTNGVGSDQPRQWDGTNLDRVSQVGPGAGPTVPPQAAPAVYGVSSIVQPYPAQGINSAAWGSALSLFNAQTAANSLWILGAPGSGAGWLGDVQIGDNIYISGMGNLEGQNPNGTYAVAGTGFFTDTTGVYPYILVQTLIAVSDFARGNAGGTYQKTQAVLTITNPIPSQSAVIGGKITVAGTTPVSWNSLWQIVGTPTLGQLLIQATSLLNNVATYTYTIASGEAPGWQEEQRYYLGSTLTDPYGNVWQAILPGISGGSSPFPASPSAGDSPYTLTAAALAGNNTEYSGTFADGGSNALVGKVYTITGFTNYGNNVINAICVASTTTLLTLYNPQGVDETDPATATYVGIGDGTAPTNVVWMQLVGASVTVTVFGTSNGNGIFNIANQPITSATSTSFTVAIASPNYVAVAEEGNGISGSANIIIIDPGTKTLNTGNPGDDPIYGSASSGGLVIPQSTGDVASGQRYAVLLFLTRNNYISPASPPTNFYTTGQSTQITFNNLAIGPPDVIARIVAITAANSQIGGPYFWIPSPVTVPGTAATLGVATTYSSTVLNDNVSTTLGPITLSDTVLLDGTNISITGNNLFNQREIGEFTKCVNYFGRNFVIGERVKVDNLVNMTFDGGVVSMLPAGWTVSAAISASVSVVPSPIVNTSLYIKELASIIVQSAQNRVYSLETSISAVLPAIPTVGNSLIFIISGVYNGSISPPSGLTSRASTTADGELVHIYTRTVMSGDAATWTFTITSGLGAVMLSIYEITGTPTFTGAASTITGPSPALSTAVVAPSGAGSLVFCAFTWASEATRGPISAISPFGADGYSDIYDFGGVQGNNYSSILFASGTAVPSSAITAITPYIGTAAYGTLLCAYSSWAPSVINPTGTSLANIASLSQDAYEDAYQEPIIDTNTAYSVRVTAKIPSGNTGGTLVIELYSPSLGQNWPVSIPFSSLSQTIKEFIVAFNNPLWQPVPSDLLLRVYPFNMLAGVDLLIDRIEVFPTNQPTYATQCNASYAQNYEAVDSITGILDTSQFTSEPQVDIFIYDEVLHIKTATKTFAFNGAQQAGEPSTWTPRQVSNTVGSCGPLATDAGEEYTIDAAPTGVFMFDGGNHTKISQEIFRIWNALYQPSLSTVWVKNDIANKRIMIGAPLPTPNQWLPNAPVNSTPSTPNVILMCRYTGLDTGPQIAEGQAVTVSMFGGRLIYKDGRRKWTLWQISSPYGDFIPRANGSKQFLMGGTPGTGQINQLTQGVRNDNGQAIQQRYMTYSFADQTTEEQLGIGSVRKLYAYGTADIYGAGNFDATFFLERPDYPFPNSQDNFPLANPNLDDTNIPMNETGNALFTDFSVDGNVNSWFTLQRFVLQVGRDPWAPVSGR